MTPTTITLGNGDFVVLDPTDTQTVRVHQGTVWMTQERDPDDHFIAAGASRALNRRGSVCIQARDATVLTLVPRRAGPARDNAISRPAAPLGWIR